jgi:hypothetical protein
MFARSLKPLPTSGFRSGKGSNLTDNLIVT